ncbi:MAG: DHHA1 domain protein [Candidatus Argoarchaeum ethanivorans]|uniref:DHHA1 domain protein n=1 Tax=Candidatus Argoarchaeum ethanivorans TaxID=2608793 RepID=A0A811T4E2_9EURY|nr:MAG: DHHA1 domain protein [Candidatus Argoarchaeum ethanivorans]
MMINDLIGIAEKAARLIVDRATSVQVISHTDADGISSAAIICTALFRCHIPFQASFVNCLEESILRKISSTDADTIILCDMGSGQPEIVKRIEKLVVILDHHKPVGEHKCMHVNPHDVGLDGSFELSASGVAYFVARLMGPNTDLSGLAILGALGDKQSMSGANQFIVEEAISCGAVEVSCGLMLEDGDLHTVLANTIEPYFEFTGDEAKLDRFLSKLSLSGDISSLDSDSVRKLASALVLTLLKRGCIEAVDAVVGEKYHLKNEIICDANKFVSIVNTCGKIEQAGIGLLLCLRDKTELEYAIRLDMENRQSLINTLKIAEQNMCEKKYIRYVKLSDISGTGIVAGITTRYLFPDKPFITVNSTSDMVKVSGRGTRKLVSQGLDLAAVMKSAAEAVGGTGGGHNIASGASIPNGREEEFITIVDQLTGEQLTLSKIL